MKNVFNEIGINTDEEVIQKILNGEIPLFEILIRRYNNILYKIGRGFGLSHQDVQDMMQDTHLKAYLNLRNFRREASYKTWLSKIMVHNCLHLMHKSSHRNEQPLIETINEEMKPIYSDPAESVVKNMNRKELVKLVEYSLEKLPLHYRTVFILREMEGFSVAETAEMLGITTVNVKVRSNRAKNLLHKELEKLYTSTDLFEFNLIYCDLVVNAVFESINRLNQC
jgi:RNA polymerase sigma factor (sigma-70 family)